MALFDLSAAQVEWYPSAFSTALGAAATQIDYVGDTIKLALLSSSHIPRPDTHDFFDDVSGNEIAMAGYSAGGVTLSGKSITLVSTTISYIAANIAFGASLQAKYAVVYKSTGTASTSPLLVLLDFLSSVTFSQLTWAASGIAKTVVP